ncbi:hypothetical protein F444_05911 [Phytophthora nicotianae P1976]|uniref:GATA-type domain-containing protein n=1 Tax=Phytophthora nicotianae P1976 TaxID=1317066 RepID=A0A081AKG3_PHYNI|nr:hypothetical protein F444_05911 [Phytophthora nicotianae P1976]
MLECQNCGAVGDSFFSENYFGEMVCELCGTQSFLQARNETQEAEDMGMDITTVLKTLKRRVVKKKRNANETVIGEERNKRLKTKEHEKEKKLPELLDCVIATQMVLDSMARALIERVGTDTFPADEYPKAVKELWFKFLKTWGVKGAKPLLRCYNEFFLFYSKEEEKSMDPAATFDLLEQWDAEWEKKNEQDEVKEEEHKQAEEKKEKTGEKPRKRVKLRRRKFDELNMFSIVDLVGILVLASRVLNLGLLPSDFAEWVTTGVIPYHNSLAACCADVPDVRDSVKFVAGFFQSLMLRHRATTVQIAYSAHHLQYHMGLRLPPLNVPLAAHRICATMGFPGEVYRNFQWITGFMNVEGEMTELPLMLQAEVDGYPRFKLKHTKKDRARVDAILESEVGIVAHLIVAIKMCANWHEWIYERSHKKDEETKESEEVRYNAPPVAAVHDAHLLPRRALDTFTQFAKQVFIDPDKSAVPEELQMHIEQLERIQTREEPGNDQCERLKSNDLYAYPAIHVDGVLAESDTEIEERMERLRSREVDGDKKMDSFFYPVFYQTQRTALHPAYEHVLEILCRKVNIPIAQVLPILAKLDKRMKSLIYHFERTKYHTELLEAGQARWKATKASLEPTIVKASYRLQRPKRDQDDSNFAFSEMLRADAP